MKSLAIAGRGGWGGSQFWTDPFSRAEARARNPSLLGEVGIISMANICRPGKQRWTSAKDSFRCFDLGVAGVPVGQLKCWWKETLCMGTAIRLLCHLGRCLIAPTFLLNLS